MSNNAPDYNDNLAFEPELTWEDLVKWVKNIAPKLIEQGHSVATYNITVVFINNICFNERGNVLTNTGAYIARNKTPRQMQTIIKALYE